MRLFLFLFLLHAGMLSAQDFTWEKDHPGIRFTAVVKDVKGSRGKEILDILNRDFPFLIHPQGFDVYQNVSIFPGTPCTGYVSVGLPKYYRFQGGAVTRQSGHYTWVSFLFNNRELLMDPHSEIFHEETKRFGFPAMFTDTFGVEEVEVNGFRMGYTVNRFANHMNRQWVLNLRHRPCFLPVTQGEYLSLWIHKLEWDLEKETRALDKDKEELKAMEARPEMKEALVQIQEYREGTRQWIAFLKRKITYYRERLAHMPEEEKKKPAHYAMPKQTARRYAAGPQVKDSVYGHMSYEPDEGVEGFVPPVRIFRYNPDFFDKSLPATSIQLLIITDGYYEEDPDPLKKFLDEKLYPRLDYAAIARLMY